MTSTCLIQKRILILTADAGFGHRSAANALAEALQETHGAECTYEIVNVLDDERTPRPLRDSQSDYDRIAREMPDVYKFGYEATDANAPAAIMDRGLQAMLYSPMRRLLDDKQPDAIISTYPLYQAPLGAVFSLTRKFIPLVTVVTDLVTVHHVWFSAYPDLTVVPTEAVRDLAIDAKVPAEQIEVIGIPVHPRLSQETRDKAAIRAELGWDHGLATLLIVGSKRSSLYVDVAHVLNHSGLPVQLIVATGGDEERYAGTAEDRVASPGARLQLRQEYADDDARRRRYHLQSGRPDRDRIAGLRPALDADGRDPRPGNGQCRVRRSTAARARGSTSR